MSLSTLSLLSAPSSPSYYSHAKDCLNLSAGCICWSWLKRRETRRSHLAVNSTAAPAAAEGELGVGARNAQDPPSLRAEPRRKLHFLEERNEEALSERLLKLSRSNKVTSAMELHSSMDALGLAPSAHSLNSLVSCLVRNGSLDEALSVFETMTNKETASGHTYSLVLKAVAGGRGPDAALHLFRTLERGEFSEKSFDIVVYNTMISISGRAKRWTEAERLWRKFKHNGLSGTVITYSLLISTFVRCGQTELAVDAYHELRERGLEPSEDIMKAVVASCTKEGNWALALDVFEEMLSRGIEPTMIAYNSLINCLGKAGEDELAFRIYENLKSSGRSPDLYTWSALLSSLYRSKRYADALQLFEGIKTEPGIRLNVHLYNAALMSCQKLGLWERSLQLLWQMEASGMEMSTISYNHVICACEVARKPKVALQVYEHMTHLKVSPDTFTYLSLIRACVWGSLWTEVEKILEHVAPDASLYNALIHGFCLRGKFTLAKKLYTKMCSMGLKPDGKTRALMLQHLPDNGARRHPRARCIYRG
ncbi:pentatricopeptide repeat-containing protein isoform X1 [Iris pallida]|uniref:Pentatricopeptide repeat-containing protein isoform X1 n=1 Tax=Iris pallida TaxID=29817 RepID=A0AAX6DGU8_IRIPA|nr:pentatricopeptide repeat-containing protein isoform X1 [Iris pallida]KAJ6834562.1 pentatricopeptide repeat-containing protein isoform X1 [Iris pallida]